MSCDELRYVVFICYFACILPKVVAAGDNLLLLPGKSMKVCDNFIVNDIPGNVSAVLSAVARLVAI